MVIVRAASPNSKIDDALTIFSGLGRDVNDTNEGYRPYNGKNQDMLVRVTYNEAFNVIIMVSGSASQTRVSESFKTQAAISWV